MRRIAARVLLWAICGAMMLSMSARAQESTVVPKEKRASSAEVRRLLKATNATTVGKQVVDQFVDMMAKTSPEVPDSVWKQMRASIEWSEITDSLIPIYQHHLTRKDIKSLTKFYESKLGKRFMAAQPSLIRESIDISRLIAVEFGKRITQELVDKGYKAPSTPQ